jgi:hypothetical protein
MILYCPSLVVIDGGSGMNRQRMVRPLARGVVAALLGGLFGAVLTRALMVSVVADGTPAFTWSGLAFIALFYIVFLMPGAVALAWSRARWPLFIFGAGAVAIPVQAAGIAQTDLEAVGPFSRASGSRSQRSSSGWRRSTRYRRRSCTGWRDGVSRRRSWSERAVARLSADGVRVCTWWLLPLL